VKKPLSAYLSEKIWAPAGMEQQATWLLSKTGQEISDGCCIQAATARLRPLRRSSSWRAPASRARASCRRLAGGSHEHAHGIGQPGRGYGYQWWTYADGSFAARGIFGQGLFIDPKRKDRDRIERELGGRCAATAPPATHAKPSTAPCRRRSTTKAPRRRRATRRADAAAPAPRAQ
jgi:hypothetical protein